MIARSAAYRPEWSSDLDAEAGNAEIFPPYAHAGTIDRPPRGRILIVEDQLSLALEMQKHLRDAGYRIVGPAGSQSEVERLVRSGRLDAAVVDADSRRSAPFAVTDWLAAEQVPFAVIADDASRLPQELVLRPLITKPVSPRALVETVDQMVNGGAGAMVIPYTRGSRLFPQL
jgi:DNA-binding NarL/FixJ family response regulator